MYMNSCKATINEPPLAFFLRLDGRFFNGSNRNGLGDNGSNCDAGEPRHCSLMECISLEFRNDSSNLKWE